jgi:hypothetical protein
MATCYDGNMDITYTIVIHMTDGTGERVLSGRSVEGTAAILRSQGVPESMLGTILGGDVDAGHWTPDETSEFKVSWKRD